MVLKVIKAIIYLPIWAALTLLEIVCMLATAFSAGFLRVVAFFMYIGLFIIFIAKVRPVTEVLCQAGLATILLVMPEIAFVLTMAVAWVKAEVTDWLVW